MIFVTNWVMAIAYLPLIRFAGGRFTESCVWDAAWAGTAFFTGQIFTFLALVKGDASVATPVMGTKVILVALLTVLLLHEPVPVQWWIAAFLTTVAAGLLGRANRGAKRNQTFTIASAFLSASAFAYTDVACQKWVPVYGFSRFIPAMFLSTAVLSFGLIPIFRGSLRQLPARTWRWLLSGAIILALQALAMAYVIGIYGHATVVNIVYSSRGMWSVLLVWFAGQWFENNEKSEHGHGVMATRFAGAGLILTAIFVVARR